MKQLPLRCQSLLRRPFRPGPARLLVAGALLALVSGSAAFGQGNALAYVTLRDATPTAGAVAVIDTTNNRVVATVPVGPGPNGMVVTPDGRRAYVTNYGTFPGQFAQATSLAKTVSVVDLSPLRNSGSSNTEKPSVIATVTVGTGPLGIAVTPDGSEVFVTNFGQDAMLVPGSEEGSTVSVISTRTNEVVDTILVGKLPAGIAVTPDGKQVYVTCRRANQVWVIDTLSHSVIATIPVQTAPANVTFTPDGKFAYVTNFGSQSVSVIDTAKKEVVPVADGVAIRVGNVPIGLTISPNGKRAYVVNAFSNNVSVIDTTTNTLVTTVAAGAGPRAAAVTPDGGRAYVSNFMSNTIYAIDTYSNTIASTINMDGGPNWVTIPR